MVNRNRQITVRIWRKKQVNTMCKENLRANITIQSDNLKNRDVHGDGDHDNVINNDNNHKLYISFKIQQHNTCMSTALS